MIHERKLSMFILILLLVFLFAVEKKGYRNIGNPAIIFTSLWLLVLFLDSKNLYGLRKIDENIANMIVLGTSFFVIGSLVAKIFDNKKFVVFSEKKLSTTIIENHLRYRLLYILLIICIIYFFIDGISSLIKLINGVSLDSIRASVQSETSSNFLDNILKNFVIWPSSYMLEAVAISDYLFGQKDKKLFLGTIFLVILRLLSDAGRTPIMDIAIYLFIGMLYLPIEFKKGILNKIKLYRYWVLGIVLLVVSTLSRTSSTVWRQLYFYFGMSPVLFLHWKQQVDIINLNTYGLAALNGVFFPIVYIIKNIFFLDYPVLFKKAYDVIADTNSNWQVIAQGGIRANAYVSIFWYFYTDFRVYGIMIGSALYGFFTRRVYSRMVKNINVFSMSLYLLLYQGVFYSFIRFPFSKAYYFLAIIYIFLVVDRRIVSYANRTDY